ncbi:MAG: Cu(I)-responsive transcriptional regulator [Alphaproteobacteria bacterium]|nr:Cu(I)-responsive transcriptional regulator [Alphaproteobacteria bacterium]
MNIGEAAKATGVSAKMIRYYESIGLMPKVVRTGAGYRVYSSNDLHTLRFIRRARDLGFAIESITRLLRLWQNRSRSSSQMKSVTTEHIGALRQRIAEMESMVRTLEHLAKHCHGDLRPECPILDDLAKPDTKAAPAKARSRPGVFRAVRA